MSRVFTGGKRAREANRDLKKRQKEERLRRNRELRVDALIVTNRATGRSRGFGFVSYQNAATADEAIKSANRVDLDGHSLKVNRAEERPGRS